MNKQEIINRIKNFLLKDRFEIYDNNLIFNEFNDNLGIKYKLLSLFNSYIFKSIFVKNIYTIWTIFIMYIWFVIFWWIYQNIFLVILSIYLMLNIYWLILSYRLINISFILLTILYSFLILFTISNIWIILWIIWYILFYWIIFFIIGAMIWGFIKWIYESITWNWSTNYKSSSSYSNTSNLKYRKQDTLKKKSSDWFFTSIFSDNWNTKSKKERAIKIEEPKLSSEEKKQLRFQQKLKSAYESVKKSWIRWTKLFYERKWILVCWNCGNVWVSYCKWCWKTMKKRKKAWRCSCWTRIDTITCTGCKSVQYLK